MFILISAAFGLIAIGGGFYALRHLRRMSGRFGSKPWRFLRIFVFLLGLVLGASQVCGINFQFAYPYPLLAPRGNVVGFPFFVVYFDDLGGDFFGPVSLLFLSMAGNAVFWGMMPPLLLTFCVWRSDKRAKLATSEKDSNSA